MAIFAPHGTLDITIEDNIILIEAQGPWNIEYLDYLHHKILWALTQVDESNYGVLLTPKGEAISVESSIEYHVNFIRHSKTKTVAVNLAHCTTSLLAENLFTKIYQTAGFKYAFFDNAFDARLWLEKELASTAIGAS